MATDRRWYGRRVAAWIALALVVGGLAQVRPAPAAESPTQVVETTTGAVIAVLANQSLSAEQRRQRVEEIVYAHFDFVTLAKLVLARNWKQMSPQQQEAFVVEFKRHLSITYGRNVESYNNERAVVIGDRQEAGDDWTVKTKIERPAASEILVDYRLRRQDGQWRVIDVTIEGVSLVANFRSQFQEIIAKQGPDKLIELLREKNNRGEPLKADARA